jgi:cohesin loading factor subunit SCC2
MKEKVDVQFEARKQFYLSKVNPFEFQDSFVANKLQTDIMHTYIDYESAELVTRFLASKRPFSKSFETYLKHVSTFYSTA